MVSGELDVTGKNKVELDLMRRPRRVRVHFKNDEVILPCNPNHFDELEWFVKEREEGEMDGPKKRRFFLEINWSVNSSRAIVWQVLY
jgi:hypothetical protein